MCKTFPGEAGGWEKGVTMARPGQGVKDQAKRTVNGPGRQGTHWGQRKTCGRGGSSDDLQGLEYQGKEPFFHVEDDGRTIQEVPEQGTA